MNVVYPAVFYKNIENDGYTVVFPDLDFGATEGENLKDAFFMASDYLGAWLYEYYIDGKEFPIARDIKDLEIEEDEFSVKEASFVSLVGVDMLEYARKSEVKTVRRNVSIPSYLNELAKRNNIAKCTIRDIRTYFFIVPPIHRNLILNYPHHFLLS